MPQVIYPLFPEGATPINEILSFAKEVIIQAQGLLNEGHGTSEAAKRMGIKQDTLLKAIQSGRLIETKKN